MTAVNAECGEIGINLDGRTFPMRPSYEAILDIEEKLGPILALSMRLRDPGQMLSLAEIATIVCSCIRSAGRARDDKWMAGVNVEKIQALIFTEGLHYAVSPLSALFYNMLTGGGEAKKKPEATSNNQQKDSPTES